MCQMCDEYEAELVRMGLIAEAEKVRAERHAEKPEAAATHPPAPKSADGRR